MSLICLLLQEAFFSGGYSVMRREKPANRIRVTSILIRGVPHMLGPEEQEGRP